MRPSSQKNRLPPWDTPRRAPFLTAIPTVVARLTDDDSEVFDDLVRFRRFRMNVITFLKLPHDVSEDTLRDVIKRSNATLLRTYEDRAQRVRTDRPEVTASI